MRALLDRMGGLLRNRPRSVMAILGTLVVAGAVVAGILMYRTYDYVQHDNDFCMSCHLMQDPFSRFEQSAHRGLGCKACHQPTFVARSRMALSQIIEQPETIEEHAEVPNERCAECHIDGNPEEWTLIAASAGHRVHMESDDPSLEGLRCVECHSASIHVFTATSQTCGQAGCHEDTTVRLGAMGQMTIHCVACHNFNRPVAPGTPADSLANALQPRRPECTACHQMRAMLANFPEDEPHGGSCGVCHDPHQQQTAAQAVQSCASAGCHSTPETLSPWHRGLEPGALAQCTDCHAAHPWNAPGLTCVACHDPATLDRPNRPRGTAPHPPAGGESFHPAAGIERMGMLPTATLAAPLLRGLGFLLQQVPRLGGGPFSHDRHATVACTACHGTAAAHGALVVRTAADCQACHHAPRMRDRCQRCHTSSEMAGTYPQDVMLDLSVWTAPRSRELAFTHGMHERVACATCHTTSGTFAASVTCASCHEDHHDFVGGTMCQACHAPQDARPGPVHDRAVHLGCGGAGCHENAAVAELPPTRPVCLTCHGAQRDHYPERPCAVCHATDWSKGVVGGGSR